MKKCLKILIVLLPITFLSTMCETNNGLEIPYIRVDRHLNIYGELGDPAVFTSKLIDGGVSGIIIYREDLDVYHAYDRTCTQWPEHLKQVAEDTEFDGVFTCPECESMYLLLTGAEPIGGPATFGLKEYYTVIDGSILHVYN